MIEQALPYLKFERITILFFTDDGEEVEEFASQTGLRISSSCLGITSVAGNRVVNKCEIWLYPDSTLHEYLEAATWETPEGGCTQRHYIGSVGVERISLEDLQEQIAFNLAPDRGEDGEKDWGLLLDTGLAVGYTETVPRDTRAVCKFP